MGISASATELVGRPVIRDGALLGTISDVFSDRLLVRQLGFEVTGTDGRRFFMPSSTCDVQHDWVESLVPNGLLSSDTLLHYSERGASWSSLRNSAVSKAGTRLGLLAEIRFDAHGACQALLVREPDGAVREVPALLAAEARSGKVSLRGRLTAAVVI